MKLRTLALTAAIGLTAVAATQAQDVSGRSLKLRGANTTAANLGTVTVPLLTAPRTYTFQDIDGTIALTTGPLSANRFIYTDAAGLITTTGALSNGQLLIGNGAGAPSAATLGVLRGLTVTNGAGTISLGMPTAVTTNSVLRFGGTDWVESGTTFTVDASGNVVAGGTLGVSGDATFGTAASATGGALILHDDAVGTAFTSTITGPVFTAARTITLPDASGTLVLSTGGTLNQLTRFGAGGTIVDASLSDDGSGVLARAGNVAINTGAANTLSSDGNASFNGDLTIGTQALAAGGSINWFDNTAAGAFSATMSGPLLYTANRTYTLPDANGTFIVGTAGTANQLTRRGADGTSIVDASLSDDGSGVLARAGNVAINTGAANTLSTDGSVTVAGTLGVSGDATFGTAASATGGALILHDDAVGTVFTSTFTGPAFTAARTITVPDASGTLVLNTGGTLNQLTRFGANGTIVDASLSDDGSGVLARAGNVAINPGAANTVTTDGSLQVDGNSTLGNAVTDLVTIGGTVRGSEDRIRAAAATNKFAGRIRITFAADGAGPAFTIANTQVTATSTILLTVQSNTGINYSAVVSAIVANTSFNVRLGGGLGVGDDLYISYMIINP